VQHRNIEIEEIDHGDGSAMFRLDRRAWFYKKTDECGEYWDYEIDLKPVLGTTEVWNLVNVTKMIHPFHVHLVEFQILDRTPFDVAHYKATGEVVFTGPAVPPDANEAGWKDVVRASPYEMTRIIMRFGPYPGYFVYHCHLLEHEDMDMMIPFEVVEPNKELL
jgi:spore coat protein A